MRLLLLLFLGIFLAACSSDVRPEPDCEPKVPAGEQLSYGRDVAPIITRTCALPDCHVRGFENGNFNNFNELQNKAEDGLLDFMIQTGQMPHFKTEGQKKLSPCEVEVIQQWVEAGAPNN